MAFATHQQIYRALKEFSPPQQEGWSIDSDDVAEGLRDELFLHTGHFKIRRFLGLKGELKTLHGGQTGELGWRLYSRDNNLGRVGIGRLALDGDKHRSFAYIVAEEELGSGQELTAGRLATEGVYRALNGYDQEQSDFLFRLQFAHGEEYSKGHETLMTYAPSQIPSAA